MAVTFTSAALTGRKGLPSCCAHAPCAVAKARTAAANTVSSDEPSKRLRCRRRLMSRATVWAEASSWRSSLWRLSQSRTAMRASSKATAASTAKHKDVDDVHCISVDLMVFNSSVIRSTSCCSRSIISSRRRSSRRRRRDCYSMTVTTMPISSTTTDITKSRVSLVVISIVLSVCQWNFLECSHQFGKDMTKRAP